MNNKLVQAKELHFVRLYARLPRFDGSDGPLPAVVATLVPASA